MKATFKNLANAICFVIVSPIAIAYFVGARVVGRQTAFKGWSQALSLIPGMLGNYLRLAFYRSTLAACSNDSQIGFGTTFSNADARIHRGVYVGLHCSLGWVTIEEDVLISSHVSLLSGAHQHGTHRNDIPIRLQPGVSVPITIGKASWIGERAVVMADVGEHCIVGAGSVVTKPIPDFAVAVGVPAQVINYRNQNRTISCA
jgi:virginiamycin A acetyltransferase